MVVSRLKNKKDLSGNEIDAFISKGGEAPAKTKEEVRFTLRVEGTMLRSLDDSRKKQVGNISRNNWILNAIHEKLQRDKSND